MIVVEEQGIQHGVFRAPDDHGEPQADACDREELPVPARRDMEVLMTSRGSFDSDMDLVEAKDRQLRAMVLGY